MVQTVLLVILSFCIPGVCIFDIMKGNLGFLCGFQILIFKEEVSISICFKRMMLIHPYGRYTTYLHAIFYSCIFE